MIEILELLPTVYFWLYVGLALAFLGQGLAGGARSEGAGRLMGMVVGALFALALGTHLFHFGTRWFINGHAPL